MNCKEGQLAIVVADIELFESFVGAVVKLERYVGNLDWESADGAIPSWEIEKMIRIKLRNQNNVDAGLILPKGFSGMLKALPDRILRPIRGDDQIEELKLKKKKFIEKVTS